MAILRTGFVAILLVCAAGASRPLESARDQYKAHEDVPHPPQLLSEATDQAVDVHQPLDVAALIKNEHNRHSKVYNKDPSSATKLQVESYKREVVNRQSNPQKILQTQKVEDPRQRRSIDSSGGINLGTNYYNPWTPSLSTIVGAPPLSSFSIWQPQYYQIRRPYYIPVWGSPGRTPLYFPPQPLFVNPGYPIDNPPREYLPPNRGYLPADPNAPPSTDNSSLIENRFIDGPVWDPAPTTSTVAPTRRTRRPGQRPITHPPLVHSTESNIAAGNQLSVATTTPRPPSSPQRPSSSAQRPSSSAQRPPSATQRPPAPEQNQPSDVIQPSRCVWAIVSCCSTSSEEVSYRCFEQLGCTGAFWDTSPCESEFARAAIANVMKYYNSK